MKQEIIHREYDTFTQDTLITISLFSHLQDETRIMIYNNYKITKRYQDVKKIIPMNDRVNVFMS